MKPFPSFPVSKLAGRILVKKSLSSDITPWPISGMQSVDIALLARLSSFGTPAKWVPGTRYPEENPKN